MARKIPPEAFDYYVSLGRDRSYRAVAEHFDVNPRSVRRVAAREGWQAMLREIEKKARQDAIERMASKMSDGHVRELEALLAVRERAVAVLEEAEITSPEEALELLKGTVRTEELICAAVAPPSRNGHRREE